MERTQTNGRTWYLVELKPHNAFFLVLVTSALGQNQRQNILCNHKSCQEGYSGVNKDGQKTEDPKGNSGKEIDWKYLKERTSVF